LFDCLVVWLVVCLFVWLVVWLIGDWLVGVTHPPSTRQHT
jgi:hypothetical protein